MEMNTVELELNAHLNGLITQIQQALQRIKEDKSDNLYLSINQLLEIWMEFSRRVVLNQAALSEIQISYWQDFLMLCKDLHVRLKDQQQNALQTFIEKFHFLLSQHVMRAIKWIFTDGDEEDTYQIVHYSEYFAERFSTNF